MERGKEIVALQSAVRSQANYGWFLVKTDQGELILDWRKHENLFILFWVYRPEGVPVNSIKDTSLEGLFDQAKALGFDLWSKPRSAFLPHRMGQD